MPKSARVLAMASRQDAPSLPASDEPATALAAARLAGRRETLAEVAAWHRRQAEILTAEADQRTGAGNGYAARLYSSAEIHIRSVQHLRSLQAAADDPAGPGLPLRVRVGRCFGGERPGVDPCLALEVFVGPEHGADDRGTLFFSREELAALRAGWPGAAFILPLGGGTDDIPRDDPA